MVANNNDIQRYANSIPKKSKKATIPILRITNVELCMMRKTILIILSIILLINIVSATEPITFFGFEDNNTNGWSTYLKANITTNVSDSLGGDGSFCGNITTLNNLNPVNYSMNTNNLSFFNFSFYYRINHTQDGAHWVLGDSDGAYADGYDVYWVNNPPNRYTLMAYNVSDQAPVCSLDTANYTDWHKLTIEANNINGSAKYYCDNLFGAEIGVRGTKPAKIDTMRIATFNVTSYLYIDNISLFSRPYTFNFYDEQDGLPFDINATNSTTLTIQCPGSREEYDITSSTTIVSIDCDYDFLKVDVTQNDQPNYYRTRTISFPEYNDPVVDWYLVNLNNRSVVEVVLILDDLTGGRWAGSTVTITRPVNEEEETIIEQEFDVDGRVYLYLMQDAAYDLLITNNYDETYTGSFIADQTEEKTITLPEIGYYPESQYYDNIDLNYTFNGTEHFWRVYFYDQLQLVNYVNFTLYNESNMAVISSASYNGYGVAWEVSDPSIVQNTTYISIVYFNHSVIGWDHERKVWGTYPVAIPHEGFEEQWGAILKWFSFLLLCTIYTLFSQKMSHWGLLVVVAMAVFLYKMEILTWASGFLLGIVGLIAGINWYRAEEVNTG